MSELLVSLNMVVKVRLTEVTFEQRSGGREGVS